METNIVDDIKKMVDNSKDNPEGLAVELAKLFENQTKGLEGNKNTILEEKRKIEEKLKNLSIKVDKIDMEEYNTLKSAKEKGKLIEAGSSSDLADLQIELNRLQTELQLKDTKLTEVSESKLNIESRLKSDKVILELTKGYTDAKVKPEFIPLLVNANKELAQTQTTEDGNINVLMKTGDNGLIPVDSFFTTFRSSDTAKSFIEANINMGGGATGSKSVEAKAKRDMSISEATAYRFKHGEEAYKNLQ